MINAFLTRDPITRVTAQMLPPSVDERARASVDGAGPDPAAAHARYMSDWPVMGELELCQPAAPLPGVLETVTIAAWNIERCKNVEESASLLRRAGADIVLATEMDWGLARSGQRHTTRDLAGALGMGYAYGVEFVELGVGDPYETTLYEGVPNEAGLHGNAILSRLPLKEVALIPLDAGGAWYVQNPKSDGQLRVGGRMAVTARVALAGGDVTLAAVHYESESDAMGRDAQTRLLLARLDELYGAGPCILGGDLNTAGLTGLTRSQVLAGAPQEPSFASFAKAGFAWRGLNAGAVTTRVPPGRPALYPLKTLDWVFARGITGFDPKVWPAISERGDYLSDHELITARFSAVSA